MADCPRLWWIFHCRRGLKSEEQILSMAARIASRYIDKYMIIVMHRNEWRALHPSIKLDVVDRACDKRVSCSQRSQVTQHIATGSHIENKNRKKERTSYQAFLTSPSSSKSTLSTDLCRALVRADIPFHKLKNPHFKGFLETYIGKKMPDESTLRKNYLEDIYKDTLTKIREHIKDGPIWVSIDETTDVEGGVLMLLVLRFYGDQFIVVGRV
uniref:Uncharacterized protein n=1 Tax=Rhodnius prolixus TaxID=13249 RepID=T1H7W2_RHOPR